MATHQVLVAVVVDVGEERLLRVLQRAEAGALGPVLEGAVTPGAVEPIGEPMGCATYMSSRPSPSASPTETPWWPFESRAKPESSVAAQSSKPMPSWRRKESLPPRAAVGDVGEDRGRGAAADGRSAAVHSTTRQPERSRRHRIVHVPVSSTRQALRALADEVEAHVGRGKPFLR